MQHFKPRRLEIAFRFQSSRGDIRIGRIEIQQMQMEGRHGPRPDDAVRVVSLLDHRGDRARDADAVAAHHHGLTGAAFFDVVAAHRV